MEKGGFSYDPDLHVGNRCLLTRMVHNKGEVSDTADSYKDPVY